ncbi:MAG TPA: hypothetical protein DD401_02050 [Prevotella sp.]|nr:hypothetical protein [Prevotella sp.]
MVTPIEKPLVLKKSPGTRKNLKSEPTANRISTLTHVHSHLGKVMLSVNQTVVGKTDDTMTKVISIEPTTLVARGKIQFFKYSPFVAMGVIIP